MESTRFVEILSGKADFKDKIIYIRKTSKEKKFKIDTEIFLKIKRGENNSARIRKRPNQEIPYQDQNEKA